MRRGHGRRFALPPKGWRTGISAKSRLCYQRVNWMGKRPRLARWGRLHHSRCRRGGPAATIRVATHETVVPPETGPEEIEMSTGANKPEHTEQGIEPVGALRGAGVDVD